MRKIIYTSFFIVFIFCGYAQNENTKWYFGNHAALDFMTNPPTILNNSAMNQFASSASIADTAGNLLFYTDGVTVWNKQHTIMANGTGLFGNTASAQSALIIKQPGNTNLYYIFTKDIVIGQLYTKGLNYSIVDMSLAAGLGSVTVKNTPVFTLLATEQLHATKHANGTDYWIMINSGWFYLYAYLLTAEGLNTNAVISNIGRPYSAYYNHINYGEFIKFSPSGQKMAAISINGIIDLYDFDNSTGLLINRIAISDVIDNGQRYGCEFSPNEKKLYSSMLQHFLSDSTTSSLIQWDLCSNSGSAIASSSTAIYTHTVNNTHPLLCSTQLAPNGKIYVAKYNSSYLGVINNPNETAANCNFDYNGQYLDTNYSTQGLPNMVSYFPMITVTNGNNNTSTNICAGTTITLTATAANTCTWNTLQTEVGIIVTPSVNTIYTVSATDENGCESSGQILISVASCLSIEKLETVNKELNIFPNPSNGIVNIDANETITILEIFDYSGKQTGSYFPNHSKFELKENSLASGLYVFKITTANYTAVRKVVIE